MELKIGDRIVTIRIRDRLPCGQFGQIVSMAPRNPYKYRVELDAPDPTFMFGSHWWFYEGDLALETPNELIGKIRTYCRAELLT